MAFSWPWKESKAPISAHLWNGTLPATRGMSRSYTKRSTSLPSAPGPRPMGGGNLQDAAVGGPFLGPSPCRANWTVYTDSVQHPNITHSPCLRPATGAHSHALLGSRKQTRLRRAAGRPPE